MFILVQLKEGLTPEPNDEMCIELLQKHYENFYMKILQQEINKLLYGDPDEVFNPDIHQDTPITDFLRDEGDSE